MRNVNELESVGEESAPDGASPPAAEGPGNGAPPSTSTGRSADGLLVALIVAAALAIRIVYVFQLQSSPYFSHHQLDARYHVEWAKAFAEGREREFLPTAYFRAPLYPWFLGTVYSIFGVSDLVPRLIQAGIGALSCGLLFILGRMVFGRIVGAIAGFAAAGYWVLVYFDGELLMESLYIFQLLLLLIFLVLSGRRQCAWLWGLSGVLLGLAAITRPNVLLLAPVLFAWALTCSRPSWGRGLGRAAALTVGCLLPILPVTIRNYAVGHDFVLIASQGGVNFYIGNNAQSDGMSARIVGDPGEWDAAMKAQAERAERAAGRTLKPSEQSRWYAGEALRWMSSQPAAAAELLLRKLGYFWTFWEIPNDQYIPFITRTFTPIVGWLPFSFTQPELGFAIVGPLAALGLLASLRRGRDAFPVTAFVLIYMLSVVLFFVNSRFRAPTLPALILLAAFGAAWLVRQLVRRRWAPFALGGLAVAAMGLVVSRLPAQVDLRIDHNLIWSQAGAGQTLYFLDKQDQAEHLLDAAARRADEHRVPLKSDAWVALGLIRMRKGAYPDAQHCFEQAVRAKPDDAAAYQNLGVSLAAQNRMTAAAAAFEQVLRLRPGDVPTQANLGNALVQSGKVEEGMELLLSALRADGKTAGSLVAASEACVRQGRQSDALRLLEAGIEKAPNNLGMLTQLIQLYTIGSDVSRRDPAKARQLADRALKVSGRKDALILQVSALAYWTAGESGEARKLAEQGLKLARQQKDRKLVTQLQALLARIESAAPEPNQP